MTRKMTIYWLGIVHNKNKRGGAVAVRVPDFFL